MSEDIKLWLEKIIYQEKKEQPTILREVLGFLSFIYGLLASFRNALFDWGLLKAYELPGGAPVVSFGNITTGGTGKTPVIIAFANHLQNLGKKVAIITRGYRSGLAPNESALLLGGNIVYSDIPPERFKGDEAYLMSEKCKNIPIIVGGNRKISTIKALRKLDFKPDYWILDDGFQHRQIKRTFDVVLCDANRPFGNGHLLPAGSLREQPSSLRRASSILLTRANKEQLENLTIPFLVEMTKVKPFPVAFVMGDLINALDSQRFTLGDLEKKTSHIICCTAISQPDRFVDALTERYRLGKITTNLLSDHSSFDIKNFVERVKNYDFIIMTEKDFYRQKAEFLNLPVSIKRRLILAPLTVQLPSEFLLSFYEAVGIKSEV